MPRNRFHLLCAALAAVVAAPALWSGCAHTEAPPGGPADSTRPYLATVYPQPGATGVPLELKARLGFSEWLDPSAGKGKVYLSPAPARKLKTELHGDEMEVTSTSSLDSGTTYVLGVLGTVKDLHGWPLESPYQLIFSTGASIDSARLEGSLSAFPGVRPPAGSFAALYPQGKELRSRFGHLARDTSGGGSRADSLPDPAREKPAYLAGTDSLGHFAFVGLRAGNYLLLGFHDNNDNQLPDLGSDKLAIGPSVAAPSGAAAPLGTAAPKGGTVPGAKAAVAPSLALSAYDTVPVRLLEAKWVGEAVTSGKSRGTVRLKVSRPLRPSVSLRPEAWAVKAKAGTAVAVLSVCLNPTTDEVELQTAPLDVDSAFTVASVSARDPYGNALDTARDEAPFTVDAKIDTAPNIPVPLGQRRISGLRDKFVFEHFLPARGLTLYHPRLVTDSVLADLRKRLEVKADTVRVAVTPARVSHHEISLRFPPLPLKGQRLSINLKPPDTAKTASGPTGAVPAGAAPGNPKAPAPVPPPAKSPGDTAHAAPAPAPAVVPVTWANLTLEDSAALGSLKFRMNPSARAARLVLRSLATGLEYGLVTPQAAEVKIDSLPAGWYAADIFRDADADGSWNPGRLKPWTPQEPFAHWADSVEVKAGSAADAAAAARPAGVDAGDLRLP
jgi:uncharacterized protein (DUF2141 family)